jgi:Icc-related predicted phosphoesterase
VEKQQPKPLLVLSGHIHEAREAEAWGTLFVNPGALKDRSAALIRLEDESELRAALGGACSGCR